MGQKRLRDVQLAVGELSTGANNSFTDVPGVQVGHVTLISGQGQLNPGKGPVRTGVTAILPHEGNLYQNKVRAAVCTLNGHTKAAGLEQIREMGVIETPIVLTNTLNVGLAVDALVEYTLRENDPREIFTVNPVVGETNDYYLNDIWGRHVKQEHVLQAIANANCDPVEEGAVGAGAGTTCFGWKGGIGTSSRKLPDAVGGYFVAALVQSNFGESRNLTVCGVPVGRTIQPPSDIALDKPQGSIMMVLATDAPLNQRQLERVCLRGGIGLGRTGSIYGNTSGDVIIGFTTANPVLWRPKKLVNAYEFMEDDNQALGLLFQAATDCMEEAIINSLFAAETVEGIDGHIRYHLPVDQVVELVKKH
ncbi:MAG: P1 family peptidase [Chloroflexi bacterium]|nr:P1 family peptidase [Chloroflexota bacterium]